MSMIKMYKIKSILLYIFTEITYNKDIPKKGEMNMDIIPISELRDTNKISEYCTHTGNPLFVTKNGTGHLVVQSYAEYQRQQEDIRTLKAILESERTQARNGGKTVSHEDIKKKYGL